MRNIIRILLLVFGIASLDQFTKWIIKANYYVGESTEVIKSFFSITYVRNPGAAFGMFANSPESIKGFLLIFLPVTFGVWLCYVIWTTRENNILLNTGYSLILAGGAGNIIDRFMYKYVVDFLDFYIGSSHWPAFNVADSSITVGAVILILDLWFTNKQAKVDEVEEQSVKEEV